MYLLLLEGCVKWGMVVKEHNKKPEKDDLQ